MAKAFITEFGARRKDSNGRILPYPKHPPLASQAVSLSDASAQSSAFAEHTRFIRISADVECAYKVGDDPTATTSDAVLAADEIEYIGVLGGDKVAIIAIEPPEPPPSEIAVDAATFDGANDFMLRGGALTGVSDDSTAIMSFWMRRDHLNGGPFVIFGNSAGTVLANVLAVSANNNRLRVETWDESFENAARYTSAAAHADGTWVHVLFSFDAASGDAHCYLNDVDVSSDIAVFGGDTDLDFVDANWSVGARSSGNSKFKGDLAEIYFAPGQFLDFSIEANRRKFISADGKPVDLETDGSGPTGTAPAVYLHLDDAEAVANFATNRGSGGDFTITGTLATASTSPSD